MKQVQEVDSKGPAKLLQTPIRKQQPFCKLSQIIAKVNEAQVPSAAKIFDLGQSPQIKGSTQIAVPGQSSFKGGVSLSSRKPYSPIIVKTQQNKISTFKKFRKVHIKKRTILTEYGDLKVKANFSKCYSDILKMISRDYGVEIPKPEIIESESTCKFTYSQLLTFQMNLKNARDLRYNKRQRTVISIFKCLGCLVSFVKASALGGHLSRCPLKELHYERLIKYYQQDHTNEDQKVERGCLCPEKKESLGKIQAQPANLSRKRPHIIQKQPHRVYLQSSDQNMSIKSGQNESSSVKNKKKMHELKQQPIDRHQTFKTSRIIRKKYFNPMKVEQKIRKGAEDDK